MKKIITLSLSLFLYCSTSLQAQISAYYNGSVTTDNDNNSTGVPGTGGFQDGFYFGNVMSMGSATAITSGRALGATNRFGLNFYTGDLVPTTPKMTIAENGAINMPKHVFAETNLHVGYTNSSTSNVNLEIKTTHWANQALRAYPILGDNTKYIAIKRTGPGVGDKAGISFKDGAGIDGEYEMRATPDGIEIAEPGITTTSLLSKFKYTYAEGVFLETPKLILTQPATKNGIGTNKYLTTNAAGQLILQTFPASTATNYWSPNGTSIFNNNTGSVGIGVNNPTAKLDVWAYDDNTLHATTTKANGIGIRGTAIGNAGSGIGGYFEGEERGVNALVQTYSEQKNLYGVLAYCRNNSYSSIGSTFGVYAEADIDDCNSAAYGVYGRINSICNNQTYTNQYAGYFDGNLYSTGLFVPSDQRLKKDIKPLSNATEIISKLNSYNYSFKTDEFKSMNLPSETQYGFLAQEIEKTLPGLINAAHSPARVNKDGKEISEAVSFTAVNYTPLIPILTQAIKEQQQQINELKELVQAMNKTNENTSRISSRSFDGASLSQNVPNPFTSTTSISYSLPTSFRSAKIGVYDLAGNELRLFNLIDTKGNVLINGGELKPAMYLYSLIIDGVAVDTKKITLTSN